MELADLSSAELGDVSSAANGFAEIVGEGADIGAAITGDCECGFSVVY